MAVSKENLPTDVVERERRIFEAQAVEEKKPEAMREKIIQGRLKKFFEETVLLEQKFIKDDKVTEKKDKNINEPVQFYTAKARQPYELVVNSVGKDQIVGYLATPKEQSAR